MTDPAREEHSFVCKNPGCRAEVGRLYELEDGFFLLDTGGAGLARTFNGVCKHCGTSIHFSVRDQQLERLVSRHKARTGRFPSTDPAADNEEQISAIQEKGKVNGYPKF